MLAVWVNVITIVVGSIFGLVFSKKISKEFSNIIQTAAGIVTIIIGLQMAFQYKSIVILTVSLMLGGLVGSWWDLDAKILSLGNLIERLVLKPKNKNSVQINKNEWNFAYAFLNSSVLFCVGAMAIVGSLKAGIEKDYTIIYTKSILDGFMAITFASAMGPGTIFSSVAIFLYQGALTTLSVFIEPFIDEVLLSELTAVGGATIVIIGLNLLKLKSIKTANYLPSILFVIIFVIGKKFIM